MDLFQLDFFKISLFLPQETLGIKAKLVYRKYSESSSSIPEEDEDSMHNSRMCKPIIFDFRFFPNNFKS